MTCLIVAEHDNSALSAASARAVTAARQIGGEIHALVAGRGCAGVAEQMARLAGVAKVWLADAPQFADRTPEAVAALIRARFADYTHYFAAASSAGKNLMPRVAALFDSAQISDIVAIESADTFVRPIYAGNALATVQSLDEKKFITLRTTAFEAAGANDAPAPVEAVEAPPPPRAASRVIGRELTQSARPELGAARVVVSGGRGLASAENFRALIEPLADRLGGAVGASRAAVDAGYAPNDFQVGQTGKIVAPELYIAVGLSGAIQHVAGMKDSKVIAAIDKDAEAPIFQAADFGLVADLFEAVPELIRELG
ncbi:MAG: FAD-binding protein [Candidatus Accumulibacter sp.]|jgi:electron transfer flavoprotein alpha subunit|nr:FAD-binding protein [Accumulibacter sp.]